MKEEKSNKPVKLTARVQTVGGLSTIEPKNYQTRQELLRYFTEHEIAYRHSKISGYRDVFTITMDEFIALSLIYDI